LQRPELHVLPLIASLLLSNSTDLLLVISMADSFWALAPPNSQQPLAKIASSQLLLQHLPHFAMPQANPRSSIAAKEISESVLLSLNAYQDFATLFLSEHRLLCRQDLPHKF
jgi:hypothetical protein